MASVGEDMVEDILLRLDVEELSRNKSVCKSWYSLISSYRFHKVHLKQHTSCKNVRISMPTYWKVPNEKLYKFNSWEVLGSSNGLVCISPLPIGDLILVNNPLTRELRKLPMPPLLTEHTYPMCFGFGYDSSTDDYKLVMGTSNSYSFPDLPESIFQVLSLKSNTWKLIGVFKYRIFHNRPAILFDGALHWLAADDNDDDDETKRVILSFDLSREEFTVINTDSVDSEQHTVNSFVGIVEDQLCIFFTSDRHRDLPCNNIWVMRGCKGERSWEKLPDTYETKYQVVHHMKNLEFVSSNNLRMSFFCDDNKCLSRAWFHIKSPLFVPSLVSPYAERPSHAKNNKTSVKSWYLKGTGREGQQQQLQPSIRRCIIEDAYEEEVREIEAVYRREVGESENFYFREEGDSISFQLLENSCAGNNEIKEIVTKIEGDTLAVKNNEKEI